MEYLEYLKCLECLEYLKLKVIMDNVTDTNGFYTEEEIYQLQNCSLCPRECRVNRFSDSLGYCGTGSGFEIASVVVHKGEEPLIGGEEGICNIFFTGCNLRCLFCQNHQISRPQSFSSSRKMIFKEVLDLIETILSKGINRVGFVSPSHVVPQLKAIIRGLNQRGLNPVTVYNSNGYEKQSVLRSLDGLIDVYLPDFKYITPDLAVKFSDAAGYPEIALKAIKEMYWQKGSGLLTDSNGQVTSGLIIRHLVLPGYAEESKKVLRFIAEEISTGVHISLMSQYHPVSGIHLDPPLNRTLYSHEYQSVVNEMHNLGFRNGWIQEMDSHSNLLPDFSNENPFT